MNKKDTTTLDRKIAKLRTKVKMFFFCFLHICIFLQKYVRMSTTAGGDVFFALGANMTSATEVIKWSREQHGKVEAGNNPMMMILETWSY